MSLIEKSNNVSASITKGSLVTVDFGEMNEASNVFIVYDVIGDYCLLYHPLYPELTITKLASELDTVGAKPKGFYQKCLEYADDNKEFLSPDSRVDLESLCIYFVLKRNLTNRQKDILAKLCGKIAAHTTMNNLAAARKIVVQNQALFDDFNTQWYINFKDIYSGKRAVKSPRQRITVFNQAGFIFAQLHTKKYSLPKK